MGDLWSVSLQRPSSLPFSIRRSKQTHGRASPASIPMKEHVRRSSSPHDSAVAPCVLARPVDRHKKSPPPNPREAPQNSTEILLPPREAVLIPACAPVRKAVQPGLKRRVRPLTSLTLS